MKLHDIEDAFKGQFVWDRKGTKLMQTNHEVEGSEDTALIIFCGLSEMHGFGVEETAEYLSVEEWEYYRLLRLFRSKMSAASERIRDGKWDTEINDLVQKVWTKSQLVQNVLRHKWKSWLNLGDLPSV